MEAELLNPTTPLGQKPLLGFWLACTWGSLIFSDALRCQPRGLVVKDHILKGNVRQAKSATLGHRRAILAHGFVTNPPSKGWVEAWLEAITLWLAMVEVEPAFLLPDMQTHKDGEAAGFGLLEQPMTYMRALAHMRAWVAKRSPHKKEEGGEMVMSTHSCKATILSWGRSVAAPLEWRASQGHHKVQNQAGNAMVQLYGRDDTQGSLQLQRLIGESARKGYVFTIPVGRGGSLPIAPLPREVAPQHDLFSTAMENQAGCQEKADTETSDTKSSESEEDAESSSSGDEQPELSRQAPAKLCWLVNQTTLIAHVGFLSSAAEGGLRLEGQAWKPRCGASIVNHRHKFALRADFPVELALCNRRCCT